MEAMSEGNWDAMEAMGEGKWDVAQTEWAKVITMTPSAMNYANRGNLFLKMKKPVAAMRDAEAALAMNPDSAKAYKVRGKARVMMGDWVQAAKDIGQGQNIDYDEDTRDDIGNIDTREVAKEVEKWLEEKHARDRRNVVIKERNATRRQDRLKKIARRLAG
ncbi:hypothetical protein T484DRAFT_1803539 [Baffinella frigidus]|nr:hypothetical protein T484DRAFT_1803539 [Cryptophyta sp. CCMP2293]